MIELKPRLNPKWIVAQIQNFPDVIRTSEDVKRDLYDRLLTVESELKICLDALKTIARFSEHPLGRIAEEALQTYNVYKCPVQDHYFKNAKSANSGTNL